jgi:hypothetical protein
MKPELAPDINRHIAPLCPRDNRVMRFEAHGIHWRVEGDRPIGESTRAYAGSTEPFEYKDLKQAVASYQCPECTVRYTPEQGYFTVVEVPAQPYFVDEPGANTLACPVHKTWLYRRERTDHRGYEWACGSDACAYCHTDVPGDWLRQ